jgi:flagellar operon protein
MSISELFRASGAITPAVGPATESGKTGAKPGVGGAPNEFQRILDRQLHFSKHAETRIKSREIPWNDAIESRISQGIDAAQAKGSREALILADNIAVIANVKSRTVITAMDKTQLKERIFTNIDSAVLV